MNQIAILNDALRTSFNPACGRIVMTSGFASMPAEIKDKVLRQIAEFTDFTRDNDPHGEHDFISVGIEDQKFFAKIDYFDLTLSCGSENPADPAVTIRVMTIMRAEDY